MASANLPDGIRSTTPTHPARVRRALAGYFPIIGWLPKYRRQWLKSDLMGGLTIWALLIPEGMAYAQLAGMPPETMFFASPVALLAYAIFGTSRQLVVAVSAAAATMSAATVIEVASPGSERFVELTAALALLVGALSILFGLLRLGFVANFISKPVQTGFVYGLALTIAMKQLPKILGIEPGQGNFFERLWDLLRHLGETNWWTLLAVGLPSLVLMLVLERFVPRLPAALLAVVFGIVVVSVFGLQAHGVSVVGEIPAALPHLAIPTVSASDLLALLGGALGLVLVTYAEAIGPARQFAAKHGKDIDQNQELIGLGMANAFAGLCGGFSIGASLSKSAANEQAGAKTQVSGLVAMGLTLLTAIALTPLFTNLPEATLGAVVVVAIRGMMDTKAMQRFFQLRRWEFGLAMVALAGVLALDVLPGLVLAVVLSLLLLIYRASRPYLALLGRVPGTNEFSDIANHPGNEPVSGVLIIRIDGPLFFANASLVRDGILERLGTAALQPAEVILDLEETSELDITGIEMLGELLDHLAARNVRLVLTGVHARVREMLQMTGLSGRIGEAHLHASVREAVIGTAPEQASGATAAASSGYEHEEAGSARQT